MQITLSVNEIIDKVLFRRDGYLREKNENSSLNEEHRTHFELLKENEKLESRVKTLTYTFQKKIKEHKKKKNNIEEIKIISNKLKELFETNKILKKDLSRIRLQRSKINEKMVLLNSSKSIQNECYCSNFENSNYHSPIKKNKFTEIVSQKDVQIECELEDKEFLFKINLKKSFLHSFKQIIEKQEEMIKSYEEDLKRLKFYKEEKIKRSINSTENILNPLKSVSSVGTIVKVNKKNKANYDKIYKKNKLEIEIEMNSKKEFSSVNFFDESYQLCSIIPSGQIDEKFNNEFIEILSSSSKFGLEEKKLKQSYENNNQCKNCLKWIEWSTNQELLLLTLENLLIVKQTELKKIYETEKQDLEAQIQNLINERNKVFEKEKKLNKKENNYHENIMQAINVINQKENILLNEIEFNQINQIVTEIPNLIQKEKINKETMTEEIQKFHVETETITKINVKTNEMQTVKIEYSISKHQNYLNICENNNEINGEIINKSKKDFESNHFQKIMQNLINPVSINECFNEIEKSEKINHAFNKSRKSNNFFKKEFENENEQSQIIFEKHRIIDNINDIEFKDESELSEINKEKIIKNESIFTNADLILNNFVNFEENLFEKQKKLANNMIIPLKDEIYLSTFRPFQNHLQMGASPSLKKHNEEIKEFKNKQNILASETNATTISESFQKKIYREKLLKTEGTVLFKESHVSEEDFNRCKFENENLKVYTNLLSSKIKVNRFQRKI